jgi:GNAT superfamily N-acetyltransferase
MTPGSPEHADASRVNIRAARPADWRSLRLILPEAVHFGSEVMILIAEDAGKKVMVGALAIAVQPRPQPVLGFRIALHVIAPFRNIGVEEMLITAAEQLVRPRGATALFTWGAIEAGSDAEKFWRLLGFDHAEQIIEGRTDVRAGLAFLDPIWDQLCQRGKVPADLTCINLNEADPQEIARLYVRYIGGSFQEILRALTGESAARGFDPYVSPVLKVGEKTVAAILARILPDRKTAFVDAIIVDPGLRNTWANVALRRTGWQHCLERGVDTIIYYTHARHRDTRHFVQKVGAITREFLEPYRMLRDPPPAG